MKTTSRAPAVTRESPIPWVRPRVAAERDAVCGMTGCVLLSAIMNDRTVGAMATQFLGAHSATPPRARADSRNR
jgi:hypothetical protein